MAFLAYDPDQDPNKKQQDQQGTNVSGASTAFDSQPPGAPQAGKPKSSGQFTNIQGYLGANKEQAQTMGANLVNKVETGAQQAQSDINNFANEKQTVNTVNPNQYLANPAAANKTEYQALRQTGGYTGPNDLSQTQNFQKASASAQKASDLVKNSGTEEGRMNLLQQTYQRPTYSRGMQKLDQVLLQNDPTSKQNLADINQKYSNISSLFDNTANEVGNSINQAKQTALANRQAIVEAENKAKQDLINPIQQRAQQAYQNNLGLIDRVNNDVSDDTLSEETLEALGLSEGQNLYDLNLSSYLTPDKSQVGLNNAANAEERARYTALASLLDDPTMNQITNDGKAINPMSLNRAQFDKDVAAKKALADQAMKDYMIDVTPTYKGSFTYDSPFNSNQVDYNTFNNFAPEADKFFSQFGSNYRYDPSNYNQFASARQALVDAAMRSGIANGNAAANETSRDALIAGLERARQQYQDAQKNYGIERRIKKG